MRWNAEQLAFIDAPHTDGVLLGCAGGGKTSCLVARVLRLIDTGQISGFLVMTFSRLACRHFREKGCKERVGAFTDQNVRTIHSVAGMILGGSSSSIQTAVSRAGKVVSAPAWVPCPSLIGVGTVIVDEAQDISKSQYGLVCALRDALGATLVLVGDANQNIFQFQGGSDRFLSDHPGFRVTLVRNYRSTRAIVALANSARPSKVNAPMISSSGDDGTKPVLLSGHPGELAACMLAVVDQALSDGGTVAIIGPIKKSYRMLNGHQTNLGLQWALHELRRAGVKFQVNYIEDVDGDAASGPEDAVVLRPDTVHLFTMHGSKGLEFDTVILLNFHHKLMGRDPTPEDAGDLRFLVYVGLTRAKKAVHLFRMTGAPVWPDFCQYAELLDVEGEDPSFSIKYDEFKPPLLYGWTALLRDARLVDEDTLAELEDLMDIDATLDVAGDGLDVVGSGRSGRQLPDERALSRLYGMWAQNTFYHAYRGCPPPCLTKIENMVRDVVAVPPKLGGAVRKMRFRLGMSNSDLLPARLVDQYADEIDSDLVKFLRVNMAEFGQRDMFLYVADRCRFFDPLALHALLTRVHASDSVALPDMWTMCLFLWQYDAETGYRWYRKYDDHVAHLRPQDDHIRRAARALPDGYRFEVQAQWPGVPIRGTADAVSFVDRTLIELKFTRDFQMSHGVQAVGYAVMLGPDRWDVLVMNLRCGATTRVRSHAVDVDPGPITELLAAVTAARP